MVVGVLKLKLMIPENHSLKGKRGVLKSIQSRVGRQFNVAVTECGDQGEPIVQRLPDSPVGRAYMHLADVVAEAAQKGAGQEPLPEVQL